MARRASVPHGKLKSYALLIQGCCKTGKATRAGGSAEGDSPLPEREVSSLHPPCPPPQAAKHGVCNSPDSLSGNAIEITGIHNHGYILPEREKKTREPRAEQRKKKRKESCSEDARDKKQGN